MKNNCFEIGTIQAFLDGEVTPEVSIGLTNHIADCEKCAAALSEAEDQSSLVFSAIEREMNTLVPSQRLWSRINESIAVEKASRPGWQRFLNALTAQLLHPSFATAAGVILIMAMFAVVWELNPPTFETAEPTVASVQPAAAVAKGNGSQSVEIAAVGGDTALISGGEVEHVTVSKLPPAALQRLVAASQNDRDVSIRPQHAILRETVRPAAAPAFLPGEESYVKTISELGRSVEAQKDVVLSPSSRVAYERDMAVVDDSIRKMRDVIRKDPRNQSAKQVLYASYQDKIDLLNSVAQREELIASTR